MKIFFHGRFVYLRFIALNQKDEFWIIPRSSDSSLINMFVMILLLKSYDFHLTLRWPKGGGNRFFQFFSGMGRAFSKLNF